MPDLSSVGRGSEVGESVSGQPTLAGHIELARLDHWVKNVFLLPGVVSALALDPRAEAAGVIPRLIIGLLALGLVASSNYTLNELTDAPYDRLHPSKCRRPIPCGRVAIRWAYAQWLLLALAGCSLGFLVSARFTAGLAIFWVLGCTYNVPPLRTKDVPYLDVLSEAATNPVRLLLGWWLVSGSSIPPASLVIAYWLAGSYFMAVKRFAEYRDLSQTMDVAAYRASLAFFTERTLLVSITFYASSAMLFFGAFIMRYRLELIASFPLVALVMAKYLSLAFEEDGAAQHPEKLYRAGGFMVSLLACTLVMLVLFFADLPALHRFFSPSVPPMSR